jgi:hypothetical protein
MSGGLKPPVLGASSRNSLPEFRRCVTWVFARNLRP